MTRIAYHPPKSVSHGHGPKVRGGRKAWEAVQTFLREPAISVLRTPLKLTIWDPSQWTEQVVVEDARQDATKAFGPVTTVSGGFFNWELPADRLQEALAFALADELRPKQQLGPVALYVSYSFTWRFMPNQHGVESDQFFGKGNSIGVSVGSRRVFIQPTFVFGSSEHDKEFIRRLQELEAAMPFKPNERYYSRVEHKKSGPGEKLVKLSPGWRSAA